MNYSWEAYENGLEFLFKRVSPEHSEYKNMCALQANLLENISKTRSAEDTTNLYSDRKQYITYLNNLAKKITGESFIELCILANLEIKYIIYMRKVIEEAFTLFNGSEEIWSDQCENIIEQFRQRSVPERISNDMSHINVRLHYIENCVANLIGFLEDFEKRCPPGRKTKERLQDRRTKIYNELLRCIKKIQDAEAFIEEFICLYQETTSSTNTEQPFANLPFPEQEHHIFRPAYDETIEGANALFDTQIDTFRSEKQNFNHELVNQQIGESYESVSEEISGSVASGDIDRTALRNKICQKFTLEELGTLCYDLTQTLHRSGSGIDETITLDSLEGKTLETKVQNLISYCDRRQLINYLIKEICRVRPNLEL